MLLGAAGLLGVDALLVAGGVQAVGALAYGLPSEGLEPADLVVGPGSAWVTAAKVELVGEVAIDLPAGPSEGVVLADASARLTTVAADLITQAEHGVDSPALLVTTDEALATAVEAEVRRRLATAARRSILARALADHGRIVLVPDLAAGIAFVNGYGPEHLSIDVADPEAAAAAIRNAGSIFVGRWSPESAGDYASGANHVLPTGGLARGVRPAGRRDVRQVLAGPADHARRPGDAAPDDPDAGRGRGPARPSRRRRGAVPGRRRPEPAR